MFKILMSGFLKVKRRGFLTMTILWHVADEAAGWLDVDEDGRYYEMTFTPAAKMK